MVEIIRQTSPPKMMLGLLNEVFHFGKDDDFDLISLLPYYELDEEEQQEQEEE